MRPSFKLPPVQVVSTARVAMASGFFANDALTSRFETVGDFAELSVLGLFAAIAMAYLVGSHRRVAFEARWLRPMMAIDWIAFGFILATSGGFESTYFAMFGLLILGGVRAIGMKRLPWIGLGVLMVFAAAGVTANLAGREDLGQQEFAIGRVVALFAYGYIAVALAFWKPHRSGPNPSGDLALAGNGHLADRVLAEAARLFQTDRGLIRWSRPEANGYRFLRDAEYRETNLLDENEPWFDGIFLYDCQARLAIRYEPDGSLFVTPPSDGAEAVARLIDATQMVFLRVDCAGFDTALAIAIDTPLSEDFAFRALDMQDRLRQRVLATLAEEAQIADAKAAERAALARNLHDSAIQSLASIRLQLASLKQAVRTNDPGSESLGRIAAIEATADTEMRSLRQLVGDLDANDVSGSELRASLKRLAASLSRQWQIACTLDPKSRIQTAGVSGHRATDAFFAIREAVSNAVRHGGADRISIRVEAAKGCLTIEVVNNGHAVGDDVPTRPRSLHGRVADSGGQIELGNAPDGVRLTIHLPAN